VIAIIAIALIIYFVMRQLEYNWQCYEGIDHLVRRNKETGDPECYSLDGRECSVVAPCDDGKKTFLKTAKDKNLTTNPLTCGAMHKKAFGYDGYNNPNHWCSRARAFLP
jgi:hypothetical protein